MLMPMDPSGTPDTSSPLTILLHECVERVLASWRRLHPDAAPPERAVRSFLDALTSLEHAADALSGVGELGDRGVAAPFAEVEGARSYAHLAGLLPRALERVVSFDAAAVAIRRPGGELFTDVCGRDAALTDLVRDRALQLHSLFVGGIEDRARALPPRPAEIRSALYVPLVAGGTVVGTTYIASARENAFTADDERVLGQLAAHASDAFGRVDGALRALRATPRQAQVLALVAAGLSDKEIAGRLGMSPRTVRTHLERVLREHGMASRTEAATAWLRGQRQ
jgi:DNA-binding CsgD family transcriptional regulator